MNDERKAKRVFIVLSVICAVFPGLVFLVYLLKIAGGLFGQHQTLYKYQEFHQDIYYVVLLGYSTIVPPLIAYLCYDEACHAKSADASSKTPISQDGLTRERNIFLGGFGALIGLNLLLQLVFGFSIGLLLGVESGLAFNAVVVLVAKATSVYFVFRLSRYLGQPVWLTILYCVLMPFSILYLIPLIGLLVEVRRARNRLGAASKSEVRRTRNRLGGASKADDAPANDKDHKPGSPLFALNPVYQLLILVAFSALFVVIVDFLLSEPKRQNTFTKPPQQHSHRQETKRQEQSNASSTPEQRRRSQAELNQSLLVATQNGDFYRMGILLDDGAQIDHRDADGNTALILAAWKCDYALVKHLLHRGADRNAATNRGNTALMQACMKGCRGVVDLLLERGADVNRRNKHGATALFFSRDDPTLVTILKAKGAVE